MLLLHWFHSRLRWIQILENWQLEANKNLVLEGHCDFVIGNHTKEIVVDAPVAFRGFSTLHKHQQ